MTRFGFLGAVEFSRRTLEALLDAGGEIALILTGSREECAVNADWVDLGATAAARGIPCARVPQGRDAEFRELLQRHRVDVLLVFGWSRLLPQSVLDAVPGGCLGTHPTLLPERRGRHPITWALVEGATESGLTVLELTEEADAGPIVWQRPFPITLDDDAASVYEKVCDLGCTAVAELVRGFEAGTIERIPQDQARATTRRRRTDADRTIRWEEASMTIYNQIRGLARPYLGAVTTFAGSDVTVWRALPPGDRRAFSGKDDIRPGTVLDLRGPTLQVATGDGHLVLTEVMGLGRSRLAVGAVLGATG